MSVLVFSHPDGLLHDTPKGHPERVERLHAVEQGLSGLAFTRRECPLGNWDDVLRAHDPDYVAKVRDAAPETDRVQMDADTWMSPGTLNAALRAVGGACAAVDAVLAGEARRAFVATRPPGHHAERNKSMGFCLFGNVAIAALRALDHHGLKRVAIVDFDVHHGNGTQDILWEEPRCLFVTSQQMPLWPGTGETNQKGAHGQIINIPLRPNSDGAAMRAAYQQQVFPALRAYSPQLLLISAGFDAHERDPLAELAWTTADYRWLTEELVQIADETAGGRVVSVLEGGYDLQALTEAVAAHVGAMTKVE
ncbi:histone deacetylase family protein [Neogemmobacter tilapiae]|uniref:histone deacetylase family protein n=1 Tax=Neogemmobacter tilapiae TaxID=875041 RepID=UPI001677D9E9|nr:histone deacetylase family protein [Gemmobacter tilapiae]